MDHEMNDLCASSHPDISVQFVFNLAASKLLLERGLGGGVEHLVADAR